MYCGMRRQKAPAKSLLGNMTGVREAVPAQGPEAEAGGSSCTLPAVHTHPFSPAPPTRAGNTGFQQKRAQIKSFLHQRGTAILVCRAGAAPENYLPFGSQESIIELWQGLSGLAGDSGAAKSTLGPEEARDKSHFLQPTFVENRSQRPPL